MFKKYIQNIKRWLQWWIGNLAKGKIKQSIKEKSPVDTWEYIAWNKDSWVITKWDTVSIDLYNDSRYAKEVEFWFRSAPVNWHKNRRAWWPVIYRWVWARVYTRTIDENRTIIKNTIINAVIAWSKL